MSTPASPAGRRAAEAAGPPPGAWDSMSLPEAGLPPDAGWPEAGLPVPGQPGVTGEPGLAGEPGAAGGGPGVGGGPGAPAPPRSPRTDPAEGPSVVRSSGIMALGTLASRGTGFLRTLMLAFALGVGTVANAYNNANTLPNTVYDLMLGGILTSIVVPLLVNAAKRDADRGEAYDQRLFTLATIALLVVTVVATPPRACW